MIRNRKQLRLAMVLGLALVVMGSLAAQPQRSSRATPAERAKELKERLSLDEQQTAKVTEIFAASQKEWEKLREKSQGDRAAMRGGMLDIARKTDEGIEALLTDAQKKEYEKVKEERRQMMQRRPPRR